MANDNEIDSENGNENDNENISEAVNENETSADGAEKEDLTDDWAAAMAEQSKATLATNTVPLEELHSDGTNPQKKPELDVILDIPVYISMEVGRTSITIRNLLQLNQGSVIELDRLAGEPLDVLVNGTLIAHGEVVVVNEKFGIRMTDVISPAERIKKLR